MICHIDIIRALQSKRFTLGNEKIIQCEINELLADRFPGLAIEREYTLDRHNIIDFLLDGRIGTEVKNKGGKRNIFRQCERYCGFKEIEIFILITNLSMGFPPEINCKPCYMVKLGNAWL